jgi:beta-glucosidase
MAENHEKLIQGPHAKASFLSTLTTRFPILQKKRGVALVVGVPLVLLCGLAGLAALPGRSSGESGGGGTADPEGVIEDDCQFYGQSPPVYPSRESADNLVTFALSRCVRTMLIAGI